MEGARSGQVRPGQVRTDDSPGILEQNVADRAGTIAERVRQAHRCKSSHRVSPIREDEREGRGKRHARRYYILSFRVLSRRHWENYGSCGQSGGETPVFSYLGGLRRFGLSCTVSELRLGGAELNVRPSDLFPHSMSELAEASLFCFRTRTWTLETPPSRQRAPSLTSRMRYGRTARITRM